MLPNRTGQRPIPEPPGPFPPTDGDLPANREWREPALRDRRTRQPSPSPESSLSPPFRLRRRPTPACRKPGPPATPCRIPRYPGQPDDWEAQTSLLVGSSLSTGRLATPPETERSLVRLLC